MQPLVRFMSVLFTRLRISNILYPEPLPVLPLLGSWPYILFPQDSFKADYKLGRIAYFFKGLLQQLFVYKIRGCILGICRIMCLEDL